MDSQAVRKRLAEVLELDLVGPRPGSRHQSEILPHAPSRWYLTGFLAPINARPEVRSDEAAHDELDCASESGSLDDHTPESQAARQTFFPSSIGLSFLISASENSLNATITWGDYEFITDRQSEAEVGDEPNAANNWQRVPRQTVVSISLSRPRTSLPVPGSGGIQLIISVRDVDAKWAASGKLSPGTRSVSIFVVNARLPSSNDQLRDTAFIFQAQLEVQSVQGFIPRPNMRGATLEDHDERIADLQYSNVHEYSVGHGIAAESESENGRCHTIRTKWIPQSTVERVEPGEVENVTLGMEELASFEEPGALIAGLMPLINQYSDWIQSQTSKIPNEPRTRSDTGRELINQADSALKRIQFGINLLRDSDVFTAFKLANKVMAIAARQRTSVIERTKPEATKPPKWRLFQLAFILLNLNAIHDPTHENSNRTVVDLLFFPTGGGKTEAYLGLAAFTLIMRRLRNPGIACAGVSILMRYTLRLLTLDQLSRATTLICALELERRRDPNRLGTWPFEIGLWVGKAATPNRMGRLGDNDQSSARTKTIAYGNNSQKSPPLPIEKCPWCGSELGQTSFRLWPNRNNPTDLHVHCSERDCPFSGDFHLPILGVDEQIYKRLPCFLIATVDKFASLPWVAETGALFGRVDRFDNQGFYSSALQSRGSPIPGGILPAPDIIIQDELHLISGPMGTIAGLYEGAIDALCERNVNGKIVRPKIIASTATVRRADRQIQALFNRKSIYVFPPQGPDVRDSFFAITKAPDEAPPRLYLGVAAQGRSQKVTLLKTYIALLSASQKIYDEFKTSKNRNPNPADPYMTLLGYFNSLRELGGSRRIVEDEIRIRLSGYSSRARLGDTEGPFANRSIKHEPVELTSRVPTHEVSGTKDHLGLPHSDKNHVDVALATNMISVGLDISRLGLMVVLGQPKTTAEYIQTTSRVGRDAKRPGLVVTLLNVHKHRDRSHYERFDYFHQTFYRNVEVTSVTPFSPRALDKGLAGAVVSLARHGLLQMTPPLGAGQILNHINNLRFVVESFSLRAADYVTRPIEEKELIRQSLRQRLDDLLDKWQRIALELQQRSTNLQYNPLETGAAAPLLHDFLDPKLNTLPQEFRSFRASRSMRDVEPSVGLIVKTLNLQDVE
ncbi:DISARM system helicase DrmA [Oligoflexus tunisiensis]|uniref:DISARM system helicase DrmA n=1 Tax=Oligoflexus tunisiensis TaxID=708132 RepID=UPI000A4E0DEB|nr:DISARM system helicase DrmA [Oligoflexus tunisiensis]